MRRKGVDLVGPPAYAVADFLVIMAPALAVKLASDRGGMGDTKGLDLVVASAIIGTAHALVAGARLRTEERTALRRPDMWIAAIDALVVLMVAATVLPVVALWRFPDEHASLADHGHPVVALWAGVLLVAVVLAEITGRVVFRWLEPHPRPRFRVRSHLIGLRSPWRRLVAPGAKATDE